MSGLVSERRRARSVRTPVRLHDGMEKRTAGVDLAALRRFVTRLNREPRFRQRSFDVTLVDDAAIAALNRRFRGKHGPTDVLSFPLEDETGAPAFERFGGDVVISIEAARRSAAAEHHSLSTELRQLILHGALHLAGYDHETDHGEMNEIELSLRQSLRITGGPDRARPQRGPAAERLRRTRKTRRRGNP